MSRAAAELLTEALRLPTQERAALIEGLLESLDERPDERAEEAWEAEIKRRLEESDSGTAQPIPWDEAQHRLRGRIRR